MYTTQIVDSKYSRTQSESPHYTQFNMYCTLLCHVSRTTFCALRHSPKHPPTFILKSLFCNCPATLVSLLAIHNNIFM